MATLSGIALRRLDGAYFDELTGGSTPLPKDWYLIGLLGYELTPAAEAAFSSATEGSRQRFLGELLKKLPDSTQQNLKAKASRIRTGSEFGRLMLNKKLTLLDLVSEEAMEATFHRLISQPLPYSVQDELDLTALSERFEIGESRAKIRENNAVLAGLIEGYDWTQSMTVTDGLRVAAVWSGGDASLATPPRFKLKRPQRRAIALALEEVLEESDYAYFDFSRNKELWKRLFTALRVSDYPVPQLQGAAHMLFENQLSSIDSIIEYLISQGDLHSLLIHFRTMPGVFARRLHEVLRKMPNRRDEILSAFSENADRVSTRVLVQLRNYFTGPSRSEAPNLPFSGKSRSARNGFLENRKVGSNDDVVAIIDSALSTKLSGKKIYLDELSEKIAVMTSNRSTAVGTRAVAPGSRVPFKSQPEYLSLFTHWRNMDDRRVDLDISGLFLSEDLGRSEVLSYYSTNSAHARYSGDITDAPDGAEEYITVDVDHAKRRGFRYMAIVINSYTGQQIGSIPECYAGIAEAVSLEFAGFDAAAVETRFDLTAQGREVIPFLLDLENLELIWTDMTFPGASHGANLDNSSSLGSMLKFILNYSGLSVADFVEKSGAIRVDSPEDADISIDARMSDQVAQLLD